MQTISHRRLRLECLRLAVENTTSSFEDHLALADIYLAYVEGMRRSRLTRVIEAELVAREAADLGLSDQQVDELRSRSLDVTRRETAPHR